MIEPWNKYLDLVSKSRSLGKIDTYEKSLRILKTPYKKGDLTLLGAFFPPSITNKPLWFTIELALDILKDVDKSERMSAIAILKGNKKRVDALHRKLKKQKNTWKTTTKGWLKPSDLLVTWNNLAEYHRPNELIIVIDSDELFESYVNNLTMYKHRHCAIVNWRSDGKMIFASLSIQKKEINILNDFNGYNPHLFIDWIKSGDIAVASYYAKINELQPLETFFYAAYGSSSSLNDILIASETITNLFQGKNVINLLKPRSNDKISDLIALLLEIDPGHGNNDQDRLAISYLSTFIGIKNTLLREELTKHDLFETTLECLKTIKPNSDHALNLIAGWYISFGAFANAYPHDKWRKYFDFGDIKKIGLYVKLMPNQDKETKKKALITLYKLFTKIFVNRNGDNNLLTVLVSQASLKFICNISSYNSEDGQSLLGNITNSFNDLYSLNPTKLHDTTSAICKYWLISLMSDIRSKKDILERYGLFAPVARLNIYPSGDDKTIISFGNESMKAFSENHSPLVMIVDTTSKAFDLAKTFAEKATVIIASKNNDGNDEYYNYLDGQHILYNQINAVKVCFRHDGDRKKLIAKDITSNITIWYTSGNWREIVCSQNGYEEKICRGYGEAHADLSSEEINAILEYSEKKPEERIVCKPFILTPTPPMYYTISIIMLCVGTIVASYTDEIQNPENILKIFYEYSDDCDIFKYFSNLIDNSLKTKVDCTAINNWYKMISENNAMEDICLKITSEWRRSLPESLKTYIISMYSDQITYNINVVVHALIDIIKFLKISNNDNQLVDI